VVVLIDNLRVDEKTIREKLEKLGNYLDTVRVSNKMKIHIHTDFPEKVKDAVRETGQILDLKVEDIAKEVEEQGGIKKASIGIVTEDVAMLLPKIIEKYQIELAYTRYDWPEEKDLPGENIYQKMREAGKKGVKTFPKTSQASPKSYLDAFQKQLQKFDKVLCITVTAKLSGCYNSAKQARSMVNNPDRIFVLDSLNAAAGEALLVLRAIELIQEQRDIAEVVEELKNLIPKIRLYFLFEDPKWIEGLGRITKSQADWIRRMKKIKIRPIMELKDGLFVKGGMIFAKDSSETLFKKILKESKKIRGENKRIRIVIGHADNPEAAEKLKEMLKEKIGAEISFVTLGPPIICAGLGPGTLLVGWTPIE
jgi:DegV family protein with EDD domain